MKRKLLDIIFFIVTVTATLLIVVLLANILGFILRTGFSPLYEQLTGLTKTEILAPERLLQMVISTLFLTITTLVLVLPFAISSAIYLHEYAKENRLAKITRFCILTLASIPSIVYGLFGMLIFVRIAGFGISIFAGAGTLAVMLTPIIMTQTENALQQVPTSYREGSASLGATRFETLKTIILPTATPGILVSIILAIGRILSESAALIFTLGTFVKMPVNNQTGLLSIFETGTTLTIRALIEFKEYGNVEAAAAIGVITIGVVIGLNLLSKTILFFTKTSNFKRLKMKFLKKHGLQIVLLIGIFILLFRMKNIFFDRPHTVQMPIAVVSREQGSGSRTTFEDYIKVNTNGNVMVLDAIIQPGNGIVANFVANNSAAIGYVSLSTFLNHGDTLRGISINGISPTPENMLSGTYTLIRPFSFVYLPKHISDIELAFIEFMASSDGLVVLENTGVIVDHTNAVAFEAEPHTPLAGSVTLGGSTSTEATVIALANEFMNIFPDVSIVYMAVGSGAGIFGAVDGIYSLGFVSREVTTIERATGINIVQYSTEGLVVVVNYKNSITNLTVMQLQAIYNGKITDWIKIY